MKKTTKNELNPSASKKAAKALEDRMSALYDKIRIHHLSNVDRRYLRMDQNGGYEHWSLGGLMTQMYLEANHPKTMKWKVLRENPYGYSTMTPFIDNGTTLSGTTRVSGVVIDWFFYGVPKFVADSMMKTLHTVESCYLDDEHTISTLKNETALIVAALRNINPKLTKSEWVELVLCAQEKLADPSILRKRLTKKTWGLITEAVASRLKVSRYAYGRTDSQWELSLRRLILKLGPKGETAYEKYKTLPNHAVRLLVS